MSKSLNSLVDNRLRLCASFVRDGAKLADIGTDHAYLPVWMCQNKKCSCAIAADIKDGPLQHASDTINSANMGSMVTIRKSDGLKEFEPDEADDIVIAGMGGEMIAKIIEECSFSRDSSKHFILQPMTRSEVLVEWLCKNGYKIIQQDCCVAAKKCYTVLLVKYTGEVFATDEVFYYLGKLKPNINETHRLFVEGHINRLYKQANKGACFAMLAKMLEKACGID